MIKIPNDTKRFAVSHKSDLFGNISETQNVNFDEAGYIKLSPRAVSFITSEDDADFNIPISLGRQDSGSYYIATTDEPFKATISPTSISITEDNESGNPALDFVSWGRWWQNRWYVTTDTGLRYKTPATGAWTDPGYSLTTNKVHALEVFRNRLTLCITNGNTVVQLNTSHSDTTTLTLPFDYEAVGLAYSNNRMGVITKLASGASGQNQNAFFFVWDGSTAAANGGYDVGSDFIVAIIPYRSSWALLTRQGQLLYFNGGGFDELAAFPFYFQPQVWGSAVNRRIIGDGMYVEGDLIFIQINNEMNAYGPKNEEVLSNAPGGVWCYDPDVGLYHRNSPSISHANLVTVTDANVNTSLETFTASAGTLPTTGNPIKYVSNAVTPIGGLKVGMVYYIIRHTATSFSLAETKADAVAGNKINITSVGDSNNYFLALDVVDYGATRIDRTGMIGATDVPNHVLAHLLFGGEYYDHDSTDDHEHLCATVNGFEARGFVVTAKVTAEEVDDDYQTIFVKYRPLRSGEKIIIKAKRKNTLGVPVSTPQSSRHCTWTSDTVFTTTADISEVESLINDNNGECEVRILSGAGGGQMAQISSIVEAGETYTVTLAESIDGASSGRLCDILIDSWEKIGEVTSTDTDGFKQFPLPGTSLWIKAKAEMRGFEVTIEELMIVNVPNQETDG